jgi:SAM-dependent methyltransferase
MSRDELFEQTSGDGAGGADTDESELAQAPTRYADVLGGLRRAYEAGAATRDRAGKTEWKIRERAAFLERLQEEGMSRLLEVGAGTGQDSLFFKHAGLSVVATDLSPAMVARCRQKGLEAYAMDFLSLDFRPVSFDAVHAMNCLLHVPNADLPGVLEAIAGLIRPGGLFFLGVYGGEASEGPSQSDSHSPPRFFSWRTDEQIQAFALEHFEVVDFHVVGEGLDRFQSLTLRRPG